MSNSIKKSDLDWLMLATKESDKDPWLEYIQVIDGVAYTTDRHRIHAVTTTLPNGVYDAYTDKLVLLSSKDARVPEKLKIDKRVDSFVKQLSNTQSKTTFNDLININGYHGYMMTECGTAGADRSYLSQALFRLEGGQASMIYAGLLDDDTNMFYGTDGVHSFFIMGLDLSVGAKERELWLNDDLNKIHIG